MAVELSEYSAARIGQIWTSDDHDFLVRTLARIDQTCVDVNPEIICESGLVAEN
jgi:hypothetical protein